VGDQKEQGRKPVKQATGPAPENIDYNQSDFNCNIDAQHNTKFGLNVLYTNADSLLNKTTELLALITDQNPDIIGVTEVVPKNAATPVIEAEITLEGYECFHNLVKAKRGVCLYVRKSLDPIAHDDLCNRQGEESVWCTVKLASRDSLLIGCVYRSPNSSVENDSAINEILVQASKLPFSHFLVLGDFNHPELDWKSVGPQHSGFLFMESVRDSFFYQHVIEPTHYRPGCRPSTIDLIFTNEEGMVKEVDYLAPLGKSHHVTLRFCFNCYHYAAGQQGSRYIYDRGDYVKLRHIIGDIDWDKEMCAKSIDQCWDIVEKKLKAAIKLCIPKRRVTSGRSHRKPLWLNGRALDKVRKKRHAFQRYLETREGEDYKAYAKARNQVKWEIKKAMKEFEKKIAQEAKSNPKAFYKYAQSKLKTRVTVSDLKQPDGSLTTSDFEKAETLNSFFSSVFTQENTEELPTFEHRQFAAPLQGVDISVEDVRKKLTGLKVSKSPGPDGIHPRVLKELSDELSIPLQHIFVKSVSEGILPQAWKDGHVSPIFKKGSRSVAGNYRPVSLTAIVCKLLEGFVRDAVLKHMSVITC
jgi:hypothetical protein